MQSLKDSTRNNITNNVFYTNIIFSYNIIKRKSNIRMLLVLYFYFNINKSFEPHS